MPLTAYLQLTASQLSNIQFYDFATRDAKSRALIWSVRTSEILTIKRMKKELPP